MKHAACYREGYPRPRFVRQSFLCLNGAWEFAFGDGDDGRKEPRIAFDKTICVPYAYNTPAGGINEQRDCETVYYRTKFSFPYASGNRVLLHLDGADYFCDVWLNGDWLGRHAGGYTRFTLDVTDHLEKENVLTVRCRDPFDPAYPRGKQRHLDRNTGCFYTPTTGLWKSVWLEETGSSYLADVWADVRFEEGYAVLDYRVERFVEGLTLCAESRFEGRPVSRASCTVTAPEGKLLLDLTDRKRQLPLKPWSAGAPGQFFDVVYTLQKDGKPVDTVGSYIGLVDYRTDGDRILINYLPATYLRMVLAQGYYPQGGLTATEEALAADVRMIKDMGFNGVRMHQKIEDERFYYYCDMLGLYSWCEMPSAYVTDERTVDAVLSQWGDAVRQYRGYLSIMAFVPFNENWGCLQVLENKRQQAFVSAAYWQTKALAPDRLAIGNDGWEHTFTDILSVHNYAQTGKELQEAYGDLPHFAAGGRVADLHTRTAFADGFGYTGQPVIVSEFGGVKFSEDDRSWGYGQGAQSAEELERRLAELVAALRGNRGIAGYCLTQFTDVEQEKNGLTTIDRKPKLAIETIARINNI